MKASFRLRNNQLTSWLVQVSSISQTVDVDQILQKSSTWKDVEEALNSKDSTEGMEIEEKEVLHNATGKHHYSDHSYYTRRKSRGLSESSQISL